jgi:hypothetical protein
MHRGLCTALIFLGAWVGMAGEQQPGADSSALLRSLPRVTDLPSSYRPIGTLADRGAFYATGTPLHRTDDGDAHHGLPATAAWATKPKDKRAQAQGRLRRRGREDHVGRICHSTSGANRRQPASTV